MPTQVGAAGAEERTRQRSRRLTVLPDLRGREIPGDTWVTFMGPWVGANPRDGGMGQVFLGRGLGLSGPEAAPGT